MFYIISYDIVENKQRAQVAKTLEGFGTRVQYSVFECLLTEDQFNVVLKRVCDLINPATDSIRSYRLCQACLDEIVIEGRGEMTREADVYIY